MVSTPHTTPHVVYVVFDRFPAPKGAAIHIAAFARALGAAFGPLELVTIGGSPADEEVPGAIRAPLPPGVLHTPLPAPGRTVIDRAMAFRSHFGVWRQGRKFPIVHFRSIFEGYPLARHKSQVCDKLVFEVNGLPSIELKYHYPAVAEDRDLIGKLVAQEQCCIEAADLIVTVSDVTANHLIARGADPARIRVIPNGVDLSIFKYRSPAAWMGQITRTGIDSLSPVLRGEGWGEGRFADVRTPPEKPLTLPLSPEYRGEGTGELPAPIRLLYSGTLASWQGADRAVEALALLRRALPATLTLIGPASRGRKDDLLRLADTLAVSAHVRLLDPLPQPALAAVHHEHDVALAPLLCNDRNIMQGCCPLKILEAMAAGTPVIASDLPVVRALAENEREALLVKPGSAKAIKDAVLRLAVDPELGQKLSTAARARVECGFTWEIGSDSLVNAYRELLGASSLS
jgi:glycosyltransferase involved in cell wall biosynthesis